MTANPEKVQSLTANLKSTYSQNTPYSDSRIKKHLITDENDY